MKIGIVRPDDKIGLKEQHAILAAYGVKTIDIHHEQKGKVPGEFPMREWAITRKIRPAHRDEIVYAQFFLLDTATDRLAPTVERIHAKSAVVVEGKTARRSDRAGDLLGMYEDAKARYSGHWLSEDQARAMRDKSPSTVGRVKKGRMPWGAAVKIIDAASSVDIGVARINAHRGYATPYNRPYVYAMNRSAANAIKLKPRISGRVQRELLGLAPLAAKIINRKRR